MQAAEVFFRVVGAIVLWAFIGFVVATAIKAFQRRDAIPAWPIAVFAVIGFAVSVARQSFAGSL